MKVTREMLQAVIDRKRLGNPLGNPRWRQLHGVIVPTKHMSPAAKRRTYRQIKLTGKQNAA